VTWTVGTECTIGKFADDTKLNGVGNTLERWDAIREDFERVERWAVGVDVA